MNCKVCEQNIPVGTEISIMFYEPVTCNDCGYQFTINQYIRAIYRGKQNNEHLFTSKKPLYCPSCSMITYNFAYPCGGYYFFETKKEEIYSKLFR